MNRRRFISTLGGSALAAIPGAVAAREAARPDHRALISTYVTNVGDLLGPDPAPVKPGSELELALHPRDYDADTIAVIGGGRMLGFLPTNQGRILKPLIEAGLPMSAVGTEVRNLPRQSVRLDISIGSELASA